MNRAILAGSVIVGIAVMLSMSTLGTANADDAVAFCHPVRGLSGSGPSHSCNNFIEVFDHIHFVTVGVGLCGGEVTEISGSGGNDVFHIDIKHGKGNCENLSERFISTPPQS